MTLTPTALIFNLMAPLTMPVKATWIFAVDWLLLAMLFTTNLPPSCLWYILARELLPLSPVVAHRLSSETP